MTSRPYAIYDVFTSEALAGNPLAVVFDSEGLDTSRMQAIAREFNLSETVFLFPPEGKMHNAALRIFMPTGELPFAGHPTVGAAVALAQQDGRLDHGPALLVLEEKVGAVRTAVKRDGTGTFAEFDLPRLPERQPCPVTKADAAAALGLDPQEIGFENHMVSAWSAGVPYVCIPVRNLGVAQRARLNDTVWLAALGNPEPLDAPNPYVYCRDTVNHDSHFHVRMFAGPHGIPEDPATGSAAAAFIGAIVHFDEPSIGRHRMILEQGIEMGRPSFIHLEIEVEHATLLAGRIGGYAVKVAEGTLFA
ncbi:phenazine biosynthesis protein PhzF [Zhengella mangrovi]|uniref:Phenazine biosynthesis protein PhzF n=1 Tax=Zhengella mangrovi TaxID=1982044 RepID=A0A2G1QQM6_9HYPH|nr:PhzF family phenazine biosynthesis protein [Zhengella mangrovi]PHP67528.1 phenazine biosynthesis protein PhzF [Zhengella mangrovi]